MTGSQDPTSTVVVPDAAGVAVSLTPLLIAAATTAAVGALGGRRDLVRGGLRLAAVQLAAQALRGAVRQFDVASTAAPPPLVVDAMAIWLADTVVGAVMGRIDPPIDQPAVA